ncbi:uncharacterized protein ZBIST_3425 [Zygosaccharomyces bailii]|nr:uncharacterized protein ZBIST_3425 [Zygosaccharomyces bailii]
MKRTLKQSHKWDIFSRPGTTGKIESPLWNTVDSSSRSDFPEECSKRHRKNHSDSNLLSNNLDFDSSVSISSPSHFDTDANYWPKFEEVFELEQTLEQMPRHRLKQFLFLHSIVNSSSDDSQFADSETDSIDYSFEYPPESTVDFYQFHMLEVPIPLINVSSEFSCTDAEDSINKILSRAKLELYSIPQSIKHLICTHDNLMGLSETIILERIVRRRALADIIPMSSVGVRKFFPLQVTYSLTDIEFKNIISIREFILTLSNKFHQKIGSFFNTTFQFTYTFNHGTFHIKYGVFEEVLDFSIGKNIMNLHAFSRYLSEDCFNNKKASKVRRRKRPEKPRKVWKSFVIMDEVFDVIDYMLRGKFSWTQNNRRLLEYIRKGGSLKVASRQYDQTVKKNQQRMLSNVRRYIRNKELIPLHQAKEKGIKNQAKLEFHCGMYDQVVGFYENIGRDLSQSRIKMYVIELEDLEEVIIKILEKYVYERYEVTANEIPSLMNFEW